jgi:hypothetical protein
MAVNWGITKQNIFWIVSASWFIHKPSTVINSKVTEGSELIRYINRIVNFCCCIKKSCYEIFSVWI